MALAGVALRVVQLVRTPELYLDWEEYGRGLVARELLDGMALHLLDHQMDPYAGGSLVMGILATPFFALFGDNVVSLKLAAIPFVAVAALASYALLARAVGRLEATLAACLVFLAPYSMSRLSLVVWGDHAQVPAFMALCLLLAWGWGIDGQRRTLWAGLLGLVAGFGLYFHYHLAIPLVLVGLLLLATDRRGLRGRRGLAALMGAFIGFLPWLLYNLSHDFEGLNISRYGAITDPGLGWFGSFAGRLWSLLWAVPAELWGFGPVVTTAPDVAHGQRVVCSLSWLAVLGCWLGLAWADRARLGELARAIARGHPGPSDEASRWVSWLFLLYLPLFTLLVAISPFDLENRPWYFADRYLTSLWLACVGLVALAAGRLWRRGGASRWAGGALGTWFLLIGAASQLSMLAGVAPGPLPEVRSQDGQLGPGHDYAILTDGRVCAGWYRGDLEPLLASIRAASGERRSKLASALGCSLAWKEGGRLEALLIQLDAQDALSDSDANGLYRGLGRGMGTWHHDSLRASLATVRGHPREDAFLDGLRASLGYWNGGAGYADSAALILDNIPARQQEPFLAALGGWIIESHKEDLAGALGVATESIPPAARATVLEGVCRVLAERIEDREGRRAALALADDRLPPDLGHGFRSCLHSAWRMPAP